MDKSEDLIHFVEDRPGHDFRYSMTSKKISNELDWKVNTPFEKGLEKRDFIGKSGTNETKYLEHLNEIINNKETVASHVINKFSKFQNLEDLYDK